jgi:type IV pilus assembly protein PilC
MPIFKYEAVDERGKRMRGAMPAVDESQLEQRLKEARLWLTEAAIDRPAASRANAATRQRYGFKLRGRRGRRELIDFCTLMIFQVRVGISLTRALDVACQDCKNPGFREVLNDLQRQLQSGQKLHEAMGRYPRVFSPHYVSVVRAGELSGKLPESFEDLRAYLEWVDEISNQVRQASLYPAIVITVVMGFTVFLFTFIIPKFAALLDSLGVQQPFLTRAVFSAGYVMKSTWWLWLSILLFVAFGIPLGRRLSKRFNYLMDRLKLHYPIFGDLNLMLALSRFAHNLAMMYRSGLSILAALHACQEGLIGNAVVEEAVGHIEEEVKGGSAIAEAMHRQPIFSALLLRMVGMGEITGNLDAALDNVAAYYNDVIPRRIKAIFSIVEPMLMLFLIFVVGCVALAIYLPIISLMGAIK